MQCAIWVSTEDDVLSRHLTKSILKIYRNQNLKFVVKNYGPDIICKRLLTTFLVFFAHYLYYFWEKLYQIQIVDNSLALFSGAGGVFDFLFDSKVWRLEFSSGKMSSLTIFKSVLLSTTLPKNPAFYQYILPISANIPLLLTPSPNEQIYVQKTKSI